MNTKLLTLLFCLLVVYVPFLQAQSSKSRDYSIDLADVLSKSEEEKLDELSKKLEEQSNVQVAFYTIDDLGGRSIEEVSLEAARELGVGFHGVNSGVLICIARNDRKLRIEVGHGIEWSITDLVAEEIVQKMVPFLKKEDYFGAMKTGFNEVKKSIGKETWFLVFKPFSKIKEGGDSSIGLIVKEDFVKIGEQSENYVMLDLYGGTAIKIYFTPYMEQTLLKEITNKKKVIFRLKNTSPLEGNLLGLD